MKTYKTLEAAAKAHGAAHGVTGKAGGWIYRNGVAICQGWRSYGYLLVDAGLIDPQDRTATQCGASRSPAAPWSGAGRTGGHAPSSTPSRTRADMPGLTAKTEFDGICPACGRHCHYKPLPGGYPPRMPQLNVTCSGCSGKVTLYAVDQNPSNPATI